MAQSSTIGFALIVGFVVYVTVRGELPAYLCVIGLGNNCPTPPANPQQSTNKQPPPPVNSTSVITAPPNAGGGGFPVYTTIDNNPPFPVITFPPPTYPTPGGGSSTSQLLCYDPYGDLVPCESQTGTYCTDLDGNTINC